MIASMSTASISLYCFSLNPEDSQLILNLIYRRVLCRPCKVVDVAACTGCAMYIPNKTRIVTLYPNILKNMASIARAIKIRPMSPLIVFTR